MKSLLEGIRVVDFPRFVMGPVCTKYLADFGAEVIRVESFTAPDLIRGQHPYRDGIPGINRSCNFAWINTSKRSITLNLKKPEGVDLAKKLVAISDVVVENFTAGTMESLGLSYEELKKVNPRIIMLSLSGLGQTGPYKSMLAAGNFIQAWAGFYNFIGMPGREPVMPYLPYPDYLGAQLGVTAIMGSLLYRKRTGKGQYIDLSMLETSIPVIGPAILDYQVNGREAKPNGNRSTHGAPHGIYRCQGEDRWCSISVFTDKEWQGFIDTLGKPAWAGEEKFATLLGRKANEDELDRYVEAWTVNHSAEEVMSLMQKNGVAAGVVQNGKDLIEDPQLQHRQHFRKVEGHQELGWHYSQVPSFKMSETPPQLGPAPILGQDNEYVFNQLLGISDEEFIDLINSGVIQ